MLSILNAYSHGYVAVALIDVCKKHGLFKILDHSKPVALRSLVKKLNANSGYLEIALAALESLGWVSRTARGAYFLTADACPSYIPDGIVELYQGPIETILHQEVQQQLLNRWIQDLIHPKTPSDFPGFRLLEGAVLLPLLIAIRHESLHQKTPFFLSLPDPLREAVIALFIHQGWAAQKKKIIKLTQLGHQLIERAYVMAIAGSYRPMLARLEELLFGDASLVFKEDSDGKESHIDRTMNVLASGFQHGRYFEDAVERVLEIFDRLPIDKQPKYIADMGCGDGTFLKGLYGAIQERSRRGEVLEEEPLTLIGLDYNQVALEETGKNLAGLPHITMSGDINHPEQLLLDLKERGIENVETILHVRSFLDHNFRYPDLKPDLQSSKKSLLSPGSVYVDGRGKRIASDTLLNAWRMHLGRWAKILNPHGLMVLESHCLSAATTRVYFTQSENFYFDTLHALSGQYLVNAETFLVLAANVGLFAEVQPSSYPKTLAFCRVTLSHFEKRNYQIRHAEQRDLAALDELEKQCWPSLLRTSEKDLEARIKSYPQGQFVLELNGCVVGVIYSQRIESKDLLRKGVTAKSVSRLHQGDGAVVQLIAVNILPKMQQMNLGDQLLEFMLQRCSLMNGVESVTGVTCCRGYDEHCGKVLKEYIHERSENGTLVDPILRFHELHGATVEGLLPGYRSEDKKNEGCGVIICYAIHHRQRKDVFLGKGQKCERLTLFQEKHSEEIDTGKVFEFLEEMIKRLIGKSKEAGFARDRPLMEMGLDSADLLELNEQVCSTYQLKLKPAFFFHYNTAEKIGVYLNDQKQIAPQEEVLGHHSNPEPQPVFAQPETHEDAVPISGKNTVKPKEGIAIIGMACRLPGGINTPEELWELLKAGQHAIRELPSGRWSWPADIDPVHDHPGINRGGFIAAIDCFDASFFRLSPKEAEWMDPQQRMLLELSWEVLDRGGYSSERLSRSNTGVFIGASGSDYARLLEQCTLPVDAHFGTGNSMALLANRISYFYNFCGPSLQVDTACSSSLVAVHEAVQSLEAGKCDQALVGGVNVMCHPANTIVYYKAGMLSRDGQCKTFDKRANGYVRAEGAVMLLLKPLEQAVLDRDPIDGVIKGIACNHGGKAGGLTVPNPEQQARVLLEAWKTAGISSETIGYIEAHGTGTSLGDPIEVRGLKEAFAQGAFPSTSVEAGTCGLSSIKSNLGHLEAAAGIAGLLKAVLSLKHRELAASLNFEKLNPHIDLSGSPFYIIEHHEPWSLRNGQYLRRAGVSSFGSGGSNAHVVVEEYQQVINADEAPSTLILGSPRLIVLSAKNKERLQIYVQRLAVYINTGPVTSLSLESMAYTLQHRQAMEERVVLMVHSFSELKEKLERLAQGEEQIEGSYRGHVKEGRDVAELFLSHDEMLQILEKWVAAGASRKIAKLWVKGVDVNWELLYKVKPERNRLPSYPFAKERYWIPIEDDKLHVTNAKKIHPLVHENTSNFEEQCFNSTFTGKEFFLADHMVKGQKVLPGAAYLEMVRAAIEEAAGYCEDGPIEMQLKHIVWTQPITVNNHGRKVHIRLFPEELPGRQSGKVGEKDKNERIQYDIYTRNLTEGEMVLHSQGIVTFNPSNKIWPLDLQAIQEECNQRRLSCEQCYQAFKAMGLDYGPSHQGIKEIFVGKDQVLAKLSLPSCVADTEKKFVLHPSIIDSALQASISLFLVMDDCGSNMSFPLLPFALQSLEIFGRCPPDSWTLIRPGKGSKVEDKVRKFDLILCDDQGNIYVQMKGLTFRSFEGAVDFSGTSVDSTRSEKMMCQPIWKEKAVQKEITSPEFAEHLVMFCELGERAPEGLEAKISGVRCFKLHSKRNGIEKRFQKYALQVFEEIQTILKEKPEGKTLIQIVVPTEGEEQLFSGLSGLLTTAHLENSKILGQVIEVDSAESGEGLLNKLKENKRYPEDTHIRYHDDMRMVIAWEEVPFQEKKVNLPWKAGGIYLITGGVGGLGLIFAKEIANKAENATLILIGRSLLNHETEEQLKEIESQGARVEYKRVDVTVKKAVIGLMSSIRKEFGGLDGIIHAAGVIRDNFILKKTVTEFKKVLISKVDGTVNLDEASRDLPLDFFILFSSSTGVIGNPGQADYAAANRFMDRYASYRNDLVASKARQGQTLSMNWPLWQEGGMKIDEAAGKMMTKSTGMIAMKTSTGIDALHHALITGRPQMMVMEGTLARIRKKLFSVVTSACSTSEVVPVKVNSSTATDTSDLLSKVQGALMLAVSKLLKVKIENLDTDAELSDYGFDSITLTDFSNHLNDQYKLELTPTVFFEHRTIADFAKYLVNEHQAVLVSEFVVHTKVETLKRNGEEKAKEGLSTKRHRPRFAGRRVVAAESRLKTASLDPIAIVGMSGKFPMARDVDEFWENLKAGRDCISEIPKDRWDWQRLYGDPHQEVNKTNIKWGGFIEGVGEFDPLFFGISPREAEQMDPQQRLLMTYIWLALEDGGYSASSLSGSNTGIFVGTMNSGYNSLITNAHIGIEGYSATGMVPSIGPNRMSYFLNLHGPSEPIETACSSSLIAIHRGVLALETGSCDLAVVGGVNTLITPEMHISFNKAGMLCEDGRCKTFSKEANGYVRGEGVGMLLLKKLQDAEDAGDHIYGLIRGSAQNHGGRANSLTAPNPKAQADLLKSVYIKADIDPRSVSYIEAHGTGTELGDPIEINGLKTAFKELYQMSPANGMATGYPNISSAHCGIGSVKTNIGHLELAAGIAGVIKVLLQLKHKTLVKSLHCDEFNPYIELKDSPFYVVQQCEEWKALRDSGGKTLPRRAGVSSFGFGGANAHVIIEEYVTPLPAKNETIKSYIIVLSAKNKDCLQDYARKLLVFITDSDSLITDQLTNLAYTLQVGREAMEERLGFIVESIEELEEKLKGFIEGRDDVEDFCRGQVKRNNETLAVFAADEEFQDTIDKWIQRRKFSKLLELWVKGLVVDWNKIYGETRPRRMSLPTYPFSRKRYWVLANDDQCRKNVELEAERSLQEVFLEREKKTVKTFDEATVIIAGAGLFGICFAYYLKQANIDFIVLEKEKGVGGVWYKNRWPGCGCDIPMIAYAYSFAHYKGPVWAKQPDILGYLEECVEKLGLSEHLILETEVMSAAYNESEGTWMVEAAGEKRFKSRFFCSAAGGLGLYPNFPEIPGIKDFEGSLFHALDYTEQSPDLHGKRLAIIGNGATQLQIVEALQPVVKNMVIYARSPKYVYPRVRYNQETEKALNENYELWLHARDEYLKNADHFYDVLHDPVRLNPYREKNEVKTFFNRTYDETHDDYYQWCMERGFIPKYAPGCNRPLISDTYHEVVRKANVEVMSCNDLAISAKGIMSSSVFQEFDAILLCTGYNFNNVCPSIPLYGEKGLSLSDYYGSGYPRGFLTYVHTFPNLILGPGPNTGTNATSITAIYEFLCEHLIKNIQYVLGHQFTSFNIRDEKVQEFTDFVCTKNEEGSFNNGCSSFYKDENDVNVVIFPGPFSTLKELYAFDPSYFHYKGGREMDGITDEYLAEELLVYLKRIVSSVLNIPISQIDDAVNFKKYGVDSIMMMNMTRHLNKSFPALTTDALLRYSSLRGFMEYILKSHRDEALQLLGGDMKPVSRRPVHLPQSKERHDVSERRETGLKDIAVIGMSGRFPKASSIAEFWENLCDGKECIDFFSNEELLKEGIPKHIVDDPDYVPAKPRLEGSDLFDPLFFSISPNDAMLMDPQHRLILEESWKALEDAGYPPTRARQAVGVYISLFMNTYQGPSGGPLSSGADASEKFRAMLGNDKDYIATRIAYKFNFSGPAYTVQTACSSSLVSVHLCAEALLRGECDIGLVGGIALTIPSKEGYFFSQDLIYSCDGHCRPFSAKAKGTIFGEGIGVVVLKRLKDAVRDNDSIYAVIKGSAVNNDGFEKKDFTAPGFLGQTEVIARALEEAKISAADVGYVEAHATGTKLGDPLEISALTDVFRRYTQQKQYCALGSVKANVGHLNTASGITGFIKTILCLRHKKIPPLIHNDPVNPDIRLDASPFYINRQLEDWIQTEGTRYAGVSSFGIGGTNVHLIIEEYQNSHSLSVTDDQAIDNRPVLIVLSAKNEERLREMAQNLHNYLASRARHHAFDMLDIAYTLQVGRQAMEERLGLIAGSVEELIEKLKGFLEDRDDVADLYRGQIKRHHETLAVFTADEELRQTIDKWIQRGTRSRILELWVKGLTFDWNTLYVEKKPSRISLPAYPFARERYWRSPMNTYSVETKRSRNDRSPNANDAIHPLLHEKVANRDKPQFISRFAGSEIFMAKYGEGAVRYIPGLFYLEMARAAGESCIEKSVKGLKNMVWGPPVKMNGHGQDIALSIHRGDTAILYDINTYGNQTITHHFGELDLNDSNESLQTVVDLGSLRSRLKRLWPESIHEYVRDRSILGVGTTRDVYCSKAELVVTLTLVDGLDDALRHMPFQPVFMNAAWQLLDFFIHHHQSDPSMKNGIPIFPFSLKRLHFYKAYPDEVIVHLARKPEAVGQHEKYNVTFYDLSGTSCIHLEEFTLKKIDQLMRVKL